MSLAVSERPKRRTKGLALFTLLLDGIEAEGIVKTTLLAAL